MTSPFRHACLALVFVATAVPANAQTWVYEPDTRPRYYEPEPGAALRAALRAALHRSCGSRTTALQWMDARARVYEPDARVVVGSAAALALDADPAHDDLSHHHPAGPRHAGRSCASGS